MARRCGFLVGVAAVLGAGGSRTVRREALSGKRIGGVPILNYEKAYQGQALLEGQALEENWVVVTKGASNAQISALCALSTCELVGHPDGGGVPFFEIRGTEKDLHKIVEQGAGLLDFIEPDGIAHIDVPADEAPEAATWGLDRIGAASRSSTGLGVHMYIFDSGVRTTHREFSGRAVATLDYTSGSDVFCSGSMDCASDNNGHGTHVAGSAAGDSFGVAQEQRRTA
jgi:subtilisin family serine protease